MVPPSDYYDDHASEFIADTLSVDMEEVYKPFLSRVPPGGRILDAGCGSGRDMLAFHNKGYDVVSTDASAKMVEMAKLLTPKEALAATMACDVMRVRTIRIRITKPIGSHDQLVFLNRQFGHLPKDRGP